MRPSGEKRKLVGFVNPVSTGVSTRPLAIVAAANAAVGLGMVGDYDQLETLMADYGMTRAFMFCLDEPDRHPSFSAANDRTLAYAERSGGRLIPFVRLDLNESPIEEANRCLDAGARGIKLHPRAQKFTSTDERLGPVFEIAAERRVPILIHGGRGLPPIAAGPRAPLARPPGGGGADPARAHRALPGGPRP